MELIDDKRTKRLKNRIQGMWFTQNRNYLFVFIELVGKSLAFPLRVLTRKNIGVESFNLGMILIGLFWIRLNVSISASLEDKTPPLHNLFNLFAFHDFTTGILNILGYVFILLCIWHSVKTEFGNQANLSVYNRGEIPLPNLIKDDAPILFRKGFIQSCVVPTLASGIGYLLYIFTETYLLGTFLLGSSAALFIDEINYHRALIRLSRIMISKENQARQKMLRLRKLAQSREET